MTDPAQLPIAMKHSLPDLAKGYMSGNVFEGREDLTRDNYAALDFQRWLKPQGNYAYAGKRADWKSPVGARTATGTFKATATGLAAGRTYEFRAVAKHPLLPLYGRDLKVRTP